MKFKLSSTQAQFIANAAMWAFFCCMVFAKRWITGESSPFGPLTSSDREALTHFIDVKSVVYFAAAFVVMFFLVAFINHRFATKEGKPNMTLLLDALSVEAASAFLSFGSLLVAIAYFLSQPTYALSGIVAWGLWLFLKPQR